MRNYQCGDREFSTVHFHHSRQQATTIALTSPIAFFSRIILLFCLQLGMMIFVLMGLSILRYDAGRLVLCGPLRRMLKIVAFCEFIRLEMSFYFF